jgi:hypothetical protein
MRQKARKRRGKMLRIGDRFQVDRAMGNGVRRVETWEVLGKTKRGRILVTRSFIDPKRHTYGNRVTLNTLETVERQTLLNWKQQYPDRYQPGTGEEV